MARKQFAAAVGPSAGSRKASPRFVKSAFKMLPRPERSGWLLFVTIAIRFLQLKRAHYDFCVTNYVNLVAEAMGIRRDDKFKKYTLWGSLERILKDADDHIAESPFENERIIEVLQAIFIR